MSEKACVTVCVATYRRPEGLKRLLVGLGELVFREDNAPDVEVVVVDNDPAGSARRCCEEARSFLSWPLTYEVEPRSGVSYARNTAVASVRHSSSFVAFVDDDEVPEPLWLDELLRVQRTYDADVVTGPVLPRFEEGQIPTWIEKGKFFERPRYHTGHPIKIARTGNVLIRKEIFDGMEEPFDERFTLTGGEDTHFFMRVVAVGYRMVWADDAVVYEWIPRNRTNAVYIIRRGYLQGRTFGRCVAELEPGTGVRAAKGSARILQGLLSILTAPFSGRHALVKGLLRILASVGVISALIEAKTDRQRFRMQASPRLRKDCRPRVAIVQKLWLHFRRGFFELLKDRLDDLETKFLQVRQPLGLPLGSWRNFTRRYAGQLWFVYWVYPYIRLIGSSLLRELRTAHARSSVASLDEKKRPKISEERRPKVAVLQKVLPQYRQRFFELLKERLDTLGIDLVLIYGQPGPGDAARKNTTGITWAHEVQNRYFRYRSREAYWQSCLGLLRDVDLVVVEQASKPLVNYVLLAQHMFGARKLAFWGHGKNFQAPGANRFSELVKHLVSRRVDWWFAYNDLSAKVVKGTGFPEHRITIVQNAIDTQQLAETRRGISSELLESTRNELHIKGENVCVYTGSMYAEKRLRFLLEACVLIKEEIPDFEMVFVGAGPDKFLVEEAASKYSWIHYVGPKFEDKKVPYFLLSKLFLMPGLVGLGILDAFALEVPLVTTAVPFHSPEIEYLKDGFNGTVVQKVNSPAAYAAAVTLLLKDEDLRQKLVEGCRRSRDRYTVEEMVERFATGVLEALR